MDEEILQDANAELDTVKDDILKLIADKDLKALKALLQDKGDIEILFVTHALDRKQQAIVFRLLNKDSALSVFEQLDTALQKELLESFSDEETLEFIEELDPDDRVALLDEMPANIAKRLISRLSAEERAHTNVLMGYEAETAGHIMTPKFISLRRSMTADDALKKIRVQAEDKETIYTLYVTDEQKKLEGVVTLRKVLIADPSARIDDIMTDKVVKVSTGTDQEKAAKTLKEFDLLAVPVVDREDRIVGIITVDDAMDIMEFEATEDIYNQAGLANITSKETNRSEVLVRGSLWAVWKVRLPFLLIALVGGIIAAVVIGGFEEVLDEIILVAFFIPLIMDLGGSVGTQSTTLFVRGVALGHIDTTPKRFLKHLGRETLIGLSIGVVVGIVTGLIAGFWGGFTEGIPLLGLAVGLALMATVTVASVIGFVVPFVLLKLKLDQAAGSAPIITTIKDVTGLVTYFLLVSLFLGALLNGDYGSACACSPCLC